MKKNLPITQQERSYPDNVPLVSTTNLKGKITFVNDAFVCVSGFKREELIGQAHNIVRHPDVPSEVFADMWQTLQRGKTWMGIIKNRCKNGDHYWVNAFVTPIIENNELTGYQSVRSKPEISQVKQAESVYRRVRQGKTRLNLSDIPLTFSMPVIAILAGLLPAVSSQWLELSGSELYIPAMIISLIGTLLVFYFLNPLKQATNRAKSYIDNPLLFEMYSDCTAEAGQLYLASLMKEAHANAITTRISYSAQKLYGLGDETLDIANQAASAIHLQASEVEHIVAIINELSSAIEEVASNANSASDATHLSNTLAQQGKSGVDATCSAIQTLAMDIEQAALKVTSLYQATSDITQVISAITDIADQTNLLALNAAIEAARAGEHGNGFAVVADEVRMLAKRTQDSTGEISRTLEQLKYDTEDVVTVMSRSQRHAQSCVGKAETAGEILQAISVNMQTVTDNSQMIAAAATEQSAASEEIRNNLKSVNIAASKATTSAEKTKLASNNLIDNVKLIMQSIAQ